MGREEDLDDPKNMQHFSDSNLPARCQGADQLTKDLLSLFSKVPDSFKKQYQAGKSSEKLARRVSVRGDTERDEKLLDIGAIQRH